MTHIVDQLFGCVDIDIECKNISIWTDMGGVGGFVVILSTNSAIPKTFLF